MKANTTYTALEILKEAGVKKPEEKLGKFRVRISGIRGIVTSSRLITIQKGTTEIDVLVGIDSYTIKLDGEEEEKVTSKGAKEFYESVASTKTESYNKLQKAKSEARDKLARKRSELNKVHKDLAPKDRKAKVEEELAVYKKEVDETVYTK